MLPIQKWKTLKSLSASFFTLSKHIPIFTYRDCCPWNCCPWDCCHWGCSHCSSCHWSCCHWSCCHWSCYHWSCCPRSCCHWSCCPRGCCLWSCCHWSVRALCTETNVHKPRRWSYNAATCKITLTFWKAEGIATKRLLAKPKTHKFVSLIGCPNNLVQSRTLRRNEHVRVSKVHEPSKNYAYRQKGSHVCDQRLFIHKAHCMCCKRLGHVCMFHWLRTLTTFFIVKQNLFEKVCYQ